MGKAAQDAASVAGSERLTRAGGWPENPMTLSLLPGSIRDTFPQTKWLEPLAGGIHGASHKGENKERGRRNGAAFAWKSRCHGA